MALEHNQVGATMLISGFVNSINNIYYH